MVMTNMGIELKLSVGVAEEYSSPAQRIRVMTEEWVSRAGFCPSCGRALSQWERPWINPAGSGLKDAKAP